MADPENRVQANGWLPYGSDDPSVLFRTPLTSRLSAADFPMYTAVHAGSLSSGFTAVATATEDQFPTHDSVLGMMATSADGLGTEAGYKLVTGLTGADGVTPCDNSGQLSIEVEASFLYTYNATHQPDVYIPATDFECALSMTVNSPGGQDSSMIEKGYAGSGNDGIVFLRGPGLVQAHEDYRNYIRSTADTAKANISLYNKDRFITINFAWKDGLIVVAVDGLITGWNATAKNIVTRLKNVFIGSDRGQDNEHTENHWVRNLQISSRYPNFGINQSKRHIAIYSDSMFDDVTVAGSVGAGESGPRYQIDRSFQQRGMRCHLSVSENGGYFIDSAQAKPLDVLIVDGVLYNETTGVPANKFYLCDLTMSVTDAVLQGGTNDGGALVAAATFESEYKARIEQVMGENGNTTTSVQRLICMTPPSRYASGENGQAIEDKIIAYQAIILSMPAWWDETYPARAGALKVVDMYEILGGQTPTAKDPTYTDILMGQVIGGGDIHYAPHGNSIYGAEIVKALWDW